jgi:tRNA (cmo5U34)-methyltransferase
MAQGEGVAFSFSAIDNFDVHIPREIRGYDILDRIVCGIADALIEDGTNVYDIGCSTGRFINKLATDLDNEADVSRKRIVTFIGFEPNGNFTSKFIPANDSVHIRKEKVTPATKFENASLITSIFTLQFVPTHERQGIIKQIYEGLNRNGAFIWAEKVLASDPKIETLLTAQHIDFKREGSSAEDILDKDRRLRAIMRPLGTAANYKMLVDAGFTRQETFWRVNNFMAILAIKS